MSAQLIGQRYANSLYALSQDGGIVDQVYTYLLSMREMITQTKDFREFIHNPLLSQEERAKVISAVFANNAPPLVLKFLLFINDKNRLSSLEQIIESFDALYLKAHNRVRAEIQIALPLEMSVREQILGQLSQKYGKDVLAQWQIRKEILGGFRIIIEGRLHDYSFTNQMEKYRQQVLS